MDKIMNRVRNAILCTERSTNFYSPFSVHPRHERKYHADCFINQSELASTI